MAALAARERHRNLSEEEREQYRKARQKETSIRHPGYEKRIAYFNEYNEAHRAERAAAERARYYRLNPERPRPVCATCGEPIP